MCPTRSPHLDLVVCKARLTRPVVWEANGDFAPQMLWPDGPGIGIHRRAPARKEDGFCLRPAAARLRRPVRLSHAGTVPPVGSHSCASTSHPSVLVNVVQPQVQ